MILSHKNDALHHCSLILYFQVFYWMLACAYKANTIKLAVSIYHHKLRGRESERAVLLIEKHMWVKVRGAPTQSIDASNTKRVYLVVKNNLYVCCRHASGIVDWGQKGGGGCLCVRPGGSISICGQRWSAFRFTGPISSYLGYPSKDRVGKLNDLHGPVVTGEYQWKVA